MSDAKDSPADSKDGLLVRPEQPASESTRRSPAENPTIKLSGGDDASNEEQPPPLPPRPTTLGSHQSVSNVVPAGFPSPQASVRPRLQATATTALSRTNIHTQSYQDGSQETYAASKQASPPSKSWGGWGSIQRLKIQDGDESASIRSFAPTLGTGADVESLLGGFSGPEHTSGWDIFNGQLEDAALQQLDNSADEEVLHNFDQEFDEIGASDAGDVDEGQSQLEATGRG